VRGKLARGDTSGAFRIEQVSRVLEVGLRRGTYTRLIRTAGLESSRTSLALALGAFHRALVVGRTPNAAMFNTVLEACFRAGDGVRARAVLAEMSREGVSMNGTTLSVLLIHTKDIGNVDAVFKLLQSQISGGRLKATPGMALSFVNAYIAAASVNSARLAADGQESVAYVERCFALIDWFYRSGVGVTASTLDTLVTHLGECGNAEGALHAWREMRRGWLGSPSKRGRRALIGAVGVSDVPSRLDVVVWPKLVPYMSDRERQRLWRMQVGLDNRHDNEIMCANSTWHDARDQAAVLHRWVRQGRRSDAKEWVSRRICDAGFVDSRILLALLGGGEKMRRTPDLQLRADEFVDKTEGSGDRATVLKYVLEQLASGNIVRAEDEDRNTLLQRIEDAIWIWMQSGGLPNELETWSDSSCPKDRQSLRKMIERIVAVSSRSPSQPPSPRRAGG
jgi:pentatricopeptide repeat protein